MRSETYHEEHEVELTEDERNLRGRQAARQALAIERHDDLVEAEAEAWRTRKKTLGVEREEMVTAQRRTCTAAESGKEPRQVLCHEEMIGSLVVTFRDDFERSHPDAQVDSRAATQDELRAAEKERGEKAKAKHEADRDPLQALRDGIVLILRHGPRDEKAVLRVLAGAHEQSTARQRKAAVEVLIERGLIRETEPGGALELVPRGDGADDDAPPTH